MYSFEYVNGTQYYIYDIVNTTTVVVLFWTFVYDMLIYYKTWIYQCLIKQVKSPSICSRTPNSVRIGQSSRTGNRGVTDANTSPYVVTGIISILDHDAYTLVDPGATHSFASKPFLYRFQIET